MKTQTNVFLTFHCIQRLFFVNNLLLGPNVGFLSNLMPKKIIF